MKHALLLVLALFAVRTAAAQEVTGLSGWNIYLDPGHSQLENKGVYGYSEAHKVLRVGLVLREMLLETTDIDTVYMSRTDDSQSVSLLQRVSHANMVGAAHYHSIHSNAGLPTSNYVFVLWPQHRDLTEAEPTGGRRMSDIMSGLLGRGMRIPSSGGIGECDFYGVEHCSTRQQRPKGSRNFVQGNTVMPSELSEAGFHTNPVQNQRNMNAEWKRLEARAMYWAILDYHGIPRPIQHIATGIIRDVESGLPINRARITVGDQTYTTDTYESLFHLYSDDPEELRNGFYYLEDLPGGTLPVIVEAEGYATYTGEVAMVDTFFTFLDVPLLSTVPPVIAYSAPADSEQGFRITSPILIEFSRPMDTTSVREAFAIYPATSGTIRWEAENRRLVFRPDSLQPTTSYTITIAGSAEGLHGDPLDGNSDGTGGDGVSISFTTGYPDTSPPRLVAATPAPNTDGVELHPVLTAVYDERIDPSTLDGQVQLERTADGYVVPGRAEAYTVAGRSVVSFFPDEELAPDRQHALVFEPGVSDIYGNVQTARQQIRFTTGVERFVATEIDNFEANVEANWWAPQASGSTIGIVTDSTDRSVEETTVNLLTGSTASLALTYGWDTDAGSWLIREYLADGAPRAVEFDDGYVLQAYVFGDGSGNQFRFAVDDGVGSSSEGHEVSPWYTVDWRGWRLVSWDLVADGTGVWLGDGVLNGTLRFDSIQLSYAPGSPAFGTLYVDDLRIATRQEVPVATEPADGLPETYALHQNYPNPFNPSTTISFDLPVRAEVTVKVYNVTGAEVATLLSGRPTAAGTHTLTWDAAGLPSGVYFCRLQAGGRSFTRKLVLLK